jgi:hypothetical protein
MSKLHTKLEHKLGNITPIFCVLVFVLLGGISYSIYVGQMVTDRIAEQTAADAAALSSANHISQGLNMMSANNLSIGAAVQVAGSMSNLAFYLGTIRALMISIDEVPNAYGTFGASPAQSKVYDRMAKISKPFMQTAAGLTRLNSSLYDYWLYTTPVRAIEVARINVPGSMSIAVPRIAFEKKSNEDMRLYQFSGMKNTQPKETVCRAYKSGDNGQSGIMDITNWLTAPFASLSNGTASTFGSALSVLNRIDSAMQDMGMTLTIGKSGSNCGLAFKLAYEIGIKVPKWLRRIGWPDYFGTVKFDHEEDLVSHGAQADYFGKEDSAKYENNFGFMVPEKVNVGDDPSLFERSIEYAQVLTTPLRSARQVNPGNCPSEWKRGNSCDGVGLVSMMNEEQQANVRDPNASTSGNQWMQGTGTNHEVNLGSGGLHEVLGSSGNMNSTFSRMKFRIAQAKAVFRPHGNAGAAMGNIARDRQHQSTLWPGWKGTLTHATLLSSILGKITDITGLDHFAQN